MLKLYLCDITDLPEEPEALPLSDYRLRRLGALRPSLVRKQSIGAELLLIRALQDAGERLPPPLDIRVTLGGKPRLTESRYHFSLSHSGRYAACALCDGPVGLDIQVQRPADERFLQRFFSSDEQHFVRTSMDSQAAFCEVWTRKESYLKATGRGMSLRMSSFSVLPGEEGRWFEERPMAEGYVFSVCGLGRKTGSTVWRRVRLEDDPEGKPSADAHAAAVGPDTP